MFFANYDAGRPVDQCADNDGHNTDAIDALTLTVPIILRYHGDPQRDEKLAELISATRRSTVLAQYAVNYADLLGAVLEGQDLRAAIAQRFRSVYMHHLSLLYHH